MTKDYYLVVKTGQAEVKAVENTARESLELLTPIIELTRGRKKWWIKLRPIHLILDWKD